MQPKKLFLLDAMALIYRAFYALNKNPRINSKGLNTSAILGFANTLYDVIQKEKPTHIGVAFDTHAPTVRHTEFVDYKAHREKAPEDLLGSIPYVQQLIEAFDIPVLYVDGYEADDVIGTLAKKAEKQGFCTYMMTPDKDFGQLVSDCIWMYKPPKFGNGAEIWGVKEVCERFGVERPEQVIDILGLWGDAADNIPGIPGIGEVKAKALIQQFGSIENLLANTHEIKNEKERLKVEQNKQMAIDSKMLATIILDVPVDFDEDALRLKEPDPAKLKPLLDELELHAFAKRVFTNLSLKPSGKAQNIEPLQSSNLNPQTSSRTPSPVTRHSSPDLFSAPDLFSELTGIEDHSPRLSNTEHTYVLVDTKEKRTDLIAQLNQQKIVCFDTETTNIDALYAELVGLAISFEKNKAFYVPFPESQAESQAIIDEFKDFFANETIEKVGQNLKYDITVLANYGISVKGTLFDTMLAHYIIDPDSRHNMDFLAKAYLDYSTVSIEELIGKKGAKQGNMRSVNVDQVKEYAGEDADITLQLHDVLIPELKKDKLEFLFRNIEMPLMPVLASIEREGVRIDEKMLGEYAQNLSSEIREVERQIYEAAGGSFNIASPKQLGDVLFDKMKIVEKAKKTGKSQQYSTSEDILSKIAHKHPIVQLILDYRSLTKLKSTYVEALPALINPKTGRLHTSFNQAVTATGRLSSTNPNLQNIPIRTERGREIRKAFIPRNEDYVLMAADYSQIELRLMAEMSGDEHMLDAFKNNIDIHTATAAKVYKVPLEEVTSEMRRHSKMVNFGIIYGISAFGLADRLGIPKSDAAEIIRNYFEQYPGVHKYMISIVEKAREQGYVETLCGRRRYLHDINSANRTLREYAERNAINAPLQGSSADMIKIAMIRIHDAFEKKNLKSKMVLQVHDELVLDVYKPEVDEVRQIVEHEMKHALQLNVPIEVEIKTAQNWLEAH